MKTKSDKPTLGDRALQLLVYGVAGFVAFLFLWHGCIPHDGDRLQPDNRGGIEVDGDRTYWGK